MRILSLINATLSSILRFKKRKILIPPNSVLFFGLNNNEILAFSNVLNLHKSHHQIGDDRYINGFPILKIYLTSLLFIPMVLFYYFKTKDTLKKLSFKYVL